MAIAKYKSSYLLSILMLLAFASGAGATVGGNGVCYDARGRYCGSRVPAGSKPGDPCVCGLFLSDFPQDALDIIALADSPPITSITLPNVGIDHFDLQFWNGRTFTDPDRGRTRYQHPPASRQKASDRRGAPARGRGC